MKKLILLSILLVVGCDEETASEQALPESESPLVGVWEFVQNVYTFTALECSTEESGGWTQTTQELQETWIINIDGSFMYDGEDITDTQAGDDGDFSGTGTWMITSNNNLVITLIDEDDIEITTYDFSISGYTLTLNEEKVNECSTELDVTTYTKQ